MGLQWGLDCGVVCELIELFELCTVERRMGGEGAAPVVMFGVGGESVPEPTELSRLKCAGHHHKGNTGSNALQILGLSGNVPIQPPVLRSKKHTPHEGESRDITTTKFYNTDKFSSDYKPVQTIITKPNLVNQLYKT